MNQEKTSYNPALSFVVSRIIPRTFYRLHLAPGVNQKISIAKNFLQKNPEYSFIIGQNHLTKDDPLFSAYIASRIDPKRIRYMFAPVSAYHIQANSEKSKMNDLANKCGVETIPVIQTYQVDHPDYNFSRSDALKNYRNFVNRIDYLRESNKSLGCIIAPEGHRSETGALNKGEKGIIKIADKLKPVLVIPLAIHSSEKLTVDKMNFGKRINLNIGDFMFIRDDGKKMDLDHFMHNLSQALPPQMRGQYK